MSHFNRIFQRKNFYSKISFDISDKGRDTSELLLFDTCIVVAKSKGKSRLEVVFAAPLNEVNLTQKDQFEPRLSLTRNNYRKNFDITANAYSDANKWISTFKDAKEAHELELSRLETEKTSLFLNTQTTFLEKVKFFQLYVFINKV